MWFNLKWLFWKFWYSLRSPEKNMKEVIKLIKELEDG